MKARLSIGVVSLALGMLFSAPAVADEACVLPSGNQLIYDRDVGDVAVLTYRAEQGLAPGQIFIVGLGGEYEGRYHYQGYWVEADDAGPVCPAALVDAEGRTWRRWGLVRLTFARPNFPSRLTLSKGECLNAPSGRLTARPVVGAGVR
jgi:hypothetical protein